MRKRTRFLLLALLTVCLLALASLGIIAAHARVSQTTTSGGQSEVAHGVTHVFIHNEAFQPTTIEVPVGTTVTWTNKDNTYHTVTIGNAMVTTENPSASGQLAPGTSFSYTFLSRGTFSYSCSDHPSIMRGTVIVI